MKTATIAAIFLTICTIGLGNSQDLTNEPESDVYTFSTKDGHYDINKSKKCWGDAKQACESQKKKLVVVETEAELKELIDRMKFQGLEHSWTFGRQGCKYFWSAVDGQEITLPIWDPDCPRSSIFGVVMIDIYRGLEILPSTREEAYICEY